jgi:hypothetical protein
MPRKSTKTQDVVQLIPATPEQTDGVTAVEPSPAVETAPAAPVAKRTRQPRVLPAETVKLRLTSRAKSPKVTKVAEAPKAPAKPKATKVVNGKTKAPAKAPAKVNGKAKSTAKKPDYVSEGTIRAWKAHRTMLERQLKNMRPSKARIAVKAKIAEYTAQIGA